MTDEDRQGSNAIDLAAGRMLRAFRLEHDTTEAFVAAKLKVAHNTISDYELGIRGRRRSRQAFLPVLAAYAAAVHAGPELVHLWQAIPTPLPLRQKWEHNALEQGEPVWLWLRPRPGETRVLADLWWGNPGRGHVNAVCGAGGVLIQFPTSVVNPGLHVHFDKPAWSDFGPGAVPPAVAEALGAIWLDAVELIEERPTLDGPLATEDLELQSSIAQIRQVIAEAPVLRHLNLRWRLIQPHLGALSKPAPEGALDSYALAEAAAEHAAVVDGDGVTSQVLLPLDTLIDLRVARGHSRLAVAKRLTVLEFASTDYVSARQLELFETSGKSSVPLLASRLDVLFGAGGRLGIERVFRSDPHDSWHREVIAFPSWWIGPIWLQCIGPRPDDIGLVRLNWGCWWRPQRVRSQMVLTTRKAFRNDEPLVVKLPPGWKLIAGLGAVPTAWDVNRDWYPINARAAAKIVGETLQAMKPQLWESQARRELHAERTLRRVKPRVSGNKR